MGRRNGERKEARVGMLEKAREKGTGCRRRNKRGKKREGKREKASLSGI